MADKTATAEPKWVYAFAAGYVDGRANMTELLGGKGANLAEMASLGLHVPPGFTITTKVCDAYYAHGRKLPDGLKPQVDKAVRLVGDAVGAHFGDVDAAAAGFGALRRPRLDAGHDGHHPQPRPQRRDRRGPRQALGRPPLRLRQLPPLHPDVCRRGARRRPWRVRGPARELQKPQRARLRHRAQGRRLGGDHRGIQEGGRGAPRPAVPAGYQRAALRRHRRGLRLLAERARQYLPPPARHPRQLGHGGHRAGDGVRQPRREQRHWRCLHAQSVDGRQGDLRRVPAQRAGRGRRRRHPHAAAADASARGARRATRTRRSKS